MSGDSELTEEDKKRTHRELCNFVNTQVRDSEEAAQEVVKKFNKWEKVRKHAIQITGDTADDVKVINDGTIPLQTVCKLESVVGKVVTFCGPVPAVIGAGASIACDAVHAFSSAYKVGKLEKMSATVLEVLDKYKEATAELLDAMNKVRRIADTLKACIKKFHSGTVTGFFDNVPSLQSFVNSVRRIRDVENLKGLKEFLLVLREEAEILADDPNFFPSLVSLLTYNPDILDLSLAIPEILVNAGIIAYGGAATGIAINCLMSLTILGIFVDVATIFRKTGEYGTYPKMAQELLKIKEELEKEEKKMSEMKKEIEKKKE